MNLNACLEAHIQLAQWCIGGAIVIEVVLILNRLQHRLIGWQAVQGVFAKLPQNSTFTFDDKLLAALLSVEHLTCFFNRIKCARAYLAHHHGITRALLSFPVEGTHSASDKHDP
jgi:hypothetical protein